MDRYRVVTSFNGVSPQLPNFLPNAPSQISLPPKPHLDDLKIFPCVRPDPAKLPGDSRAADDTELSIFDADRYFNGSQDSNFTPKKHTETLNVATQSCNISLNQREASVSSSNGFRSFRATPRASSESSWNSQAALLRKSQSPFFSGGRGVANGEQSKNSSSSGRRFFGCRCPCYGKKSVDVVKKTDHLPQISIPQICVKDNTFAAKVQRFKTEELNRDEEGEQMSKAKLFAGTPPPNPEIFRAPGRFSLDHPFPAPENIARTVESGIFSFPDLSSRKENAPKDPARVSLEVFQPPETSTPRKKSTDFQNNHFSKEIGDRRRFTYPGSPKMRAALDDDVASDTSSDLFEIESLSTQMGMRRRDSVDELPSSLFAPPALQRVRDEEGAATPSIAPSECYPPSEVSVDWSVITAEGFDRSSVANFSCAASEYDELRYAAESIGRWKKKGVAGAGGGGGGLLSCRSEKAVNAVGPKPGWFGPETQRRVGSSNSRLDRVRVARLSPGNPVHAGVGLTGRAHLPDPAQKNQLMGRVGGLANLR